MQTTSPQIVAVPIGAKGRWPAFEGFDEARPLLVLNDMLAVRDPELAGHSEQVGRYAASLALQLGIRDFQTERIRLAGVLHDVGKIVVPEPVLSKRDPLTVEEWEWIYEHPAAGARLIAAVGFNDIATWVLSHHERWDGLGYPHGLTGEEIPVEARIIAVADAYDSMTATRPYRSSISHRDALDELERCAGSQFDPAVVAALGEATGLLR